jgi:hypothetical protein
MPPVREPVAVPPHSTICPVLLFFSIVDGVVQAVINVNSDTISSVFFMIVFL